RDPQAAPAVLIAPPAFPRASPRASLSAALSNPGTEVLTALYTPARLQYSGRAFQTLLRRQVLKKVAISFGLAFSLFTFSAAAAEWTGYISDAACATKKTAAAESDAHAGCAQGCAKKGGALMLVSGGKAYKIDDQAKVQDHVGHKVTVTGK